MVELSHMVLNTVLIPVGIVFLLFATPIAAAVRTVSWMYRAIFPESIAGKVCPFHLCGRSSPSACSNLLV